SLSPKRPAEEGYERLSQQQKYATSRGCVTIRAKGKACRQTGADTHGRKVTPYGGRMSETQGSVEGVLEVLANGSGFLRVRENYAPSPKDPYVPANLIRKYRLRAGDLVAGTARPPAGRERSP